MAKPSFQSKTPEQIRADILPPGWDPLMVATFFATADEASGPGGMMRAASDAGPARAADAAVDALSWADLRAATDLGHVLDRFLADVIDITPIGDEGSDGSDEAIDDDLSDGAGAKPEGTGGGKTKERDSGTETGGGAKGGGKGNGKDKPTNIDEPTDTTGDTTNDSPTNTNDTSGTTTPDTNTGPTSPDTYVSGLDTPQGFNVEIVWVGSWTDALMQDVIWAAETISDIVTGDLVSHNGIDDLRITASITSVDGGGGAFAWGGYTSVRADSYLPSQGYIRLDSADLSTMQSYGLVDDIAFHEILHAMGFGTAWNAMGLVDNVNGDLRFTGENAIQAYNDIYATIAANDPLSAIGVPVETDGGSGTAGVHWDHETFGAEMMTGTLNTRQNVISDMTIAALEDMGYDTIYASDDFLFA
jgi:hypothetical protein